MKKIYLFIYLILIITLATSCNSHDSQDEPQKEIIDDNNEFVIDNTAIIGTWFHPSDQYCGNDNYISFDGNCHGQMAYAADQFTNPLVETLFTNRCEFVLVTFSYNINGNILHIIPNQSIQPFDLKVLEQSSSKMNLQFPSDFTVARLTFEKINDDAEWFTKSGPASEDLTIGLTGIYEADSDRLRKFTVEKVNNWTLAISDRFGDRTVGYLYWCDLHNASFNGCRTLHPIDNPTSALAQYEFRSDGKLYAVKLHDDYSATKISD